MHSERLTQVELFVDIKKSIQCISEAEMSLFFVFLNLTAVVNSSHAPEVSKLQVCLACARYLRLSLFLIV